VAALRRRLNGNHLTGPIPRELAGISSLKVVWVKINFKCLVFYPLQVNTQFDNLPTLFFQWCFKQWFMWDDSHIWTIWTHSSEQVSFIASLYLLANFVKINSKHLGSLFQTSAVSSSVRYVSCPLLSVQHRYMTLHFVFCTHLYVYIIDP